MRKAHRTLTTHKRRLYTGRRARLSMSRLHPDHGKEVPCRRRKGEARNKAAWRGLDSGVVGQRPREATRDFTKRYRHMSRIWFRGFITILLTCGLPLVASHADDAASRSKRELRQDAAENRSEALLKDHSAASRRPRKLHAPDDQSTCRDCAELRCEQPTTSPGRSGATNERPSRVECSLRPSVR